MGGRGGKVPKKDQVVTFNICYFCGGPGPARPRPRPRQWPGSDYKMAGSSLSLKFNFWSKIAEEGDKLKTVLIDDN